MDIDSLDRFVVMQEQYYAIALGEIRGGKKKSHWMWYIFPQLRGLGMSARSHAYGIADIDEARAYLSHPLLSARLAEISEALLLIDGKSAEDIFGDVDSKKLQSSMTLFALISAKGSVYHRVLERYFNGIADAQTLELLGK